MENQEIVNILIGIGLSVCGWFVRQMWDAVQTLKNDLQKLEIELPTKYVRKQDLDQRLDRIDDMLDKLFERLDKKVDK